MGSGLEAVFFQSAAVPQKENPYDAAHTAQFKAAIAAYGQAMADANTSVTKEAELWQTVRAGLSSRTDGFTSNSRELAFFISNPELDNLPQQRKDEIMGLLMTDLSSIGSAPDLSTGDRVELQQQAIDTLTILTPVDEKNPWAPTINQAIFDHLHAMHDDNPALAAENAAFLSGGFLPNASAAQSDMGQTLGAIARTYFSDAIHGNKYQKEQAGVVAENLFIVGNKGDPLTEDLLTMARENHEAIGYSEEKIKAKIGLPLTGSDPSITPDAPTTAPQAPTPTGPAPIRPKLP